CLSNFNHDAPPPYAIYPLSLHDALPISRGGLEGQQPALAPALRGDAAAGQSTDCCAARGRASFLPRRKQHARTSAARQRASLHRSEEHTSELQSRENLVCRLLLEKKKNL